VTFTHQNAFAMGQPTNLHRSLQVLVYKICRKFMMHP
jgi:hypothetical protein